MARWSSSLPSNGKNVTAIMNTATIWRLLILGYWIRFQQTRKHRLRSTGINYSTARHRCRSIVRRRRIYTSPQVSNSQNGDEITVYDSSGSAARRCCRRQSCYMTFTSVETRLDCGRRWRQLNVENSALTDWNNIVNICYKTRTPFVFTAAINKNGIVSGKMA